MPSSKIFDSQMDKQMKSNYERKEKIDKIMKATGLSEEDVKKLLS